MLTGYNWKTTNLFCFSRTGSRLKLFHSWLSSVVLLLNRSYSKSCKHVGKATRAKRKCRKKLYCLGTGDIIRANWIIVLAGLSQICIPSLQTILPGCISRIGCLYYPASHYYDITSSFIYDLHKIISQIQLTLCHFRFFFHWSHGMTTISSYLDTPRILVPYACDHHEMGFWTHSSKVIILFPHTFRNKYAS